MSRKSFHDLSRWGQMKRLKKNVETNKESTTVNAKENTHKTGGFESFDDGKSNTEVHETRNILGSQTSASLHQQSVLAEEIAWYDLVNEPPVEDDSDYALPSLTENEKLLVDLKNWAVRFRISHIAISAILSILRMHKCFNLPCDARTLLQTPLTVSVESVSPGLYSHIGLEYNLSKLWNKVTEVVDSIHIMIGIDGLPLFTSSSQSFWPIMGFVNNVKEIKSIVFPIGIFFGKKKPDNCSSFLKAFVTEAANLVHNGILLKGKVVKVVIQGFVCDAPAKSYILGIKSHTGYSSCTKCKQRGTWYHNRMIFPNCDSLPRTHEEFLSKKDEDFHLNDTPLVNIPNIHFIKSFPLDYMHLVCLGVVRTLFYIWLFAPVPLKFPHRIIDLLSSNFISLSDHMPCEFSRKPRGLDEIRRWKATEFRQVLLYTGPIVFNNVLKSEYKCIYEHFLTLSIAMSILLHPEYCHKHLQYAKNLLMHFVKTCAKIYGLQYITHNFHGLTHIAEDVLTFNSLNSCSAFKFENYMQQFKKCIRKGDKPLQQLVKRLGEMSNSDSWSSDYRINSPTFSSPHFCGPLLTGCDASKQYRTLQLQSFKITNAHPNSTCCLKDGEIVIVSNIVFSSKLQTMVILCREFKEKENFYNNPFIHSSNLGIYVVSNLSSDLQEKPISDISQKVVLLPFQTKHVAFPMLHSDE